MQSAVFVDRDGVIIENRDGYVRSWADVQFIPGALEALAKLAGSRYAIVLVTNQSAVGRGLISLQEAQEINRRVVAVASAGKGLTSVAGSGVAESTSGVARPTDGVAGPTGGVAGA